MKRIIGLFYVLFVLFCTSGWAETVYLKDGRVIKGKIEERADYYILMYEGNMPRKYYSAQIDHIEEDAPAGTVTADVAESLDINVVQYEKISTQKALLIASLIEASGIRKALEQNMKQIIEQVPPQSKAQLEAIFKANELIEMLIPIYDKYYDEEEIKKLIEFYQSPVGQKFLEVTPKIVQESMEGSVEYFKKKVPSGVNP